jgi:hypothetical protein
MVLFDTWLRQWTATPCSSSLSTHSRMIALASTTFSRGTHQPDRLSILWKGQKRLDSTWSTALSESKTTPRLVKADPPDLQTTRTTKRSSLPFTSRKEHIQRTGEARPRELWQIQKRALKEKFAGDIWAPRKKLSPDALEGIRDLHVQDPEKYSTAALADHFKVSPEAIRRILKSKWTPNEAEREDRHRRWEKRGEAIWSQMAELGVKPPKKWRERGITDPRHMPIKEQSSFIPLTAQTSSSSSRSQAHLPISSRIL